MREDDSDKLIWKYTLDGKFNIKSLNTVLHPHRARVWWSDYIWHNIIPPKYNGFMWKLFHKALSVEVSCKKLNISLASKCFYYRQNEEETIEHLFLQSDLANYIRDKIKPSFDIQYNGEDLTAYLKKWFLGTKINSQYGFIKVCYPIIVCYNIWEARNSIRKDQSSLNPFATFLKIQNEVLAVQNNYVPTQASTYIESLSIASMNINILAPNIKRGAWINWQLPHSRHIKLNFDGSKANNKAAGGGILRNCSGVCLLAYSNSQHTEIIDIELHALLTGLDIAKNHNISIGCVEGDNKLIIDALNKHSLIWSCGYQLKEAPSIIDQ